MAKKKKTKPKTKAAPLELVSTVTAAEMLGTSRWTVRRHVMENPELGALVGGRWVVRKDALPALRKLLG